MTHRLERMHAQLTFHERLPRRTRLGQRQQQQPNQQRMPPASRNWCVPKLSSRRALLHQSRSSWAQAERTSTPPEEKCSECLRAAQLEERMECGSSRASLSRRCGYRQGVMARGSEGEVHRAANCIAPQS
jgi:hypothetical protein